MPLEALIFDVDGTLAETEELHRHAFNASFAAAGLPWHWDHALYAELLAVTGGKERIAPFHRPAQQLPPLAADAVARLHADKTARYTARVAAGHVCACGPASPACCARRSSAGLRLAIATTTSPPNVEALLRATLGRGRAGMVRGHRRRRLRAGQEAGAGHLPAGARASRLAARSSCIAFEDTVNGLLARREAPASRPS